MTATSKVPGVLADVQVLTASEAMRAVASIDAERTQWRSIHADYPVYALGTPSYIDGPRIGFAGYQAESGRLNPILSARFDWLYERLRSRVSSMVGAEARFDPRLALPGFHIFLSDPPRPLPSASVHFDQQYEQIDWTSLGKPERDRQLSLTLALALPASGGGLLLWDINRLALEQMQRDERLAHRAAHRDPAYHPYTIGRLAVHSGHQLHQIAPTRDLQPRDRRITLQAHTLPVDREWVIHW